MKLLRLIILSVLIISTISTILFFRHVELEGRVQDELFTTTDNRPSITFLLGVDKDDQLFFNLAEKHFLRDSVEKTDRVVKSCQSLQAMLNHLQMSQSEQPWGVINLVVHGNMWGGLSVPMWNEGSRAYPKDFYRAAQQGEFPMLSASIIDKKTKVNVWACGIGKNPLINSALETLFTNEEGISADVYASPHFVVFQEVPGRSAPVRIKASYWPYFFQRGYRPSDSEIIHQLKLQHPDLSIDWHHAMQTESINPDMNVFHNEFNIPVVWTVLYPDKNSRPDVGTEEEKMQWIKNQPELMRKIEDLEIPLDKYNWTVTKIIYAHPDGGIQPAIKAIGMCTILCVLLPGV